jgi:hypothetical protein
VLLADGLANCPTRPVKCVPGVMARTRWLRPGSAYTTVKVFPDVNVICTLD